MQNRFERRYRMLKTDEYSSVFTLRRTKSNAYFQIFVGPNSLGHARLGLVVAKKVAKRAHERNYMKRLVREWFRCHKHTLSEKDFIVRAKKKFEREDYAEAVAALASLIQRQNQ
ncbi:MAG: ribonuclease P protein component [Neisseriaceae bacterium]|nr:ribonuclease P protein component [Neisseriaceae bacterium]MBP6862309.1 ribonuclease P protein component [Neisseriaceae bacterium]